MRVLIPSLYDNGNTWHDQSFFGGGGGGGGEMPDPIQNVKDERCANFQGDRTRIKIIEEEEIEMEKILYLIRCTQDLYLNNNFRLKGN